MSLNPKRSPRPKPPNLKDCCRTLKCKPGCVCANETEVSAWMSGLLKAVNSDEKNAISGGDGNDSNNIKSS